MCNRLKTRQIRYFAPATISASKPGEFPLGSLQSRAAVRAMLAAQAEIQRMEENAALANLTPFAEAMSEGGESPLERIWLANFAYLAEERAAVHGLSLPTSEQVRHPEK